MNPSAKPFISVVVCAFNEEKLLRLCLDGLAAQTYPRKNYEILVIDDESTDRTFEIASDAIGTLGIDAPRIRLVRIQHGGLSVARNSGIQLSEGEIIAFIDGDALPTPTWLQELVKPFQSGTDYVGGRIELLNTDSWIARFLQRTRNRQFFGPRLFNDQCIGCNMAFRKEVFSAVGGFQENFVARGDESTLRQRIRDRFHYAPAPDAVVLHERPDTVMKSVRVEWKSATLSSLEKKASGGKEHRKSLFVLVERFFMTFFLLLLCVGWFAPGVLWIPLTLAALATMRQLYLRPLNRAIAVGLIRDYGVARGAFGHFVFCYGHSLLRFFGKLASPWLYNNVKIIPPLTTPLRALEIVDSAQENVSVRCLELSTHPREARSQSAHVDPCAGK